MTKAIVEVKLEAKAWVCAWGLVLGLLSQEGWSAPPAKAAQDLLGEAFRQCVLALEPMGQKSSELGVTILGGTRLGKAGFFTLTPGGAVYFHGCPDAQSGVSVAVSYPKKVGAGAGYEVPAGRTLFAVNPSAFPKKFLKEWRLERAGNAASKLTCEGSLVRDAATLGTVRKHLESLLPAKGRFRNEKLEADRLRTQAAEVLKKKQRRAAAAELRDGQVAQVHRSSRQQIQAESLRLLDERVGPLASCRSVLEPLKPKESALMAHLSEVLGSLEKVRWQLNPAARPTEGSGQGSEGTEAGKAR